MEIISRKEALSLGLKRYFTGKPCRYGHTAERRVATWTCVVCEYANTLRWQAANPEKVKISQKKQWFKNHDKNLEKSRLYREQNRDMKLAGTRRWRDQNLDHVKAYSKKYYDENREWIREHNREFMKTPAGLALSRAACQRRRARKKDAPGGGVSHAQIREALALAKVCPDCGVRFSRNINKTLDHVIPLSRGGAHSIENIRVVCGGCNSSKGNRVFTSNGQGMLL